MSTVRKREWTTTKGKKKEAWVVAYTDRKGKRRIKTFRKGSKHEADTWAAATTTALSQNTHTPVDKTKTVATAATDWYTYLQGEEVEAAYLHGCKQHYRDWIAPSLGNVKLADLNSVLINEFKDELLAAVLAGKIKRNTASKILVSFKGIIRDARRRGTIATDPSAGVTIKMKSRDETPLEVGKDIPTREEIARIIDAAPAGRTRTCLLVAIFTGARASEIRGFRWSEIDLVKGEVHVRQRMDKYNVAGKPKSKTSARTIPIGPYVVNTLKDWKTRCPKSDLDLVFPTGNGKVESHGNAYNRILKRTLIAAGITQKYGLHSLRHFFCSFAGGRKALGGRELPLVEVSRLMGHSSLQQTNRYSHLFPRQDDHAELAASELSLITIPGGKA
jgi:integrase